MSLKKETEKSVLSQVKGLIQIIVKVGTEKKLVIFLSSTSHLLRGTQNIANGRQVLYSNTLKANELKVSISLKENKLICFINSKGSFQLHDLVNDFWRKYFGIHIFSPWWCTQCTKSLSKQGIQKKNVYQNFQFS